MPAYLTDDCWACVMRRNWLVALHLVAATAVATAAAFLPVVVLPYIAVIVTATLIVSLQEHVH